MKTNFQLVSDMNEAFNNPKGDPNNIKGERLKKQCMNIGSEFKELMACFGVRVDMTFTQDTDTRGHDNDESVIDNIRDALCDIHVFAYGAHHFMGYDADRDMEEVVDAVMTRFCVDIEQLEKTVDHYQDKGVKFYSEGSFPRICLKSAYDQQMPEYPKGKFLKAVGYRTPKFYQVPVPVAEVIVEQPVMTTFEATQSVVEQMAQQRLSKISTEIDKKAAIERQITAFRAILEFEAFGLPPFTDEKNNGGGTFIPPNN